MTVKEYNEMISKLKDATDLRMLSWEKKDGNNDSSFSSTVGKCRLDINSYYDNMIDDDTYSLCLYNEKGEVFRILNYSPSNNNSQFVELPNLYASVRDSYYHITESEKNIMDTLNSMIPF